MHPKVESIAESLKKSGQSSGPADENDSIPGVRNAAGFTEQDSDRLTNEGGNSPTNWSRFGSGAGQAKKPPQAPQYHDPSGQSGE